MTKELSSSFDLHFGKVEVGCDDFCCMLLLLALDTDSTTKGSLVPEGS